MDYRSVFTRQGYTLLFILIAGIAATGLFIPLMDNDAAHHAMIALHMYRTGDYVNLIDNGQDYLDKPHLLFWLASLSYKLFGVNAFAYKFPSFLFAAGGVYAVYRLGDLLYDKKTGRLASLLAASSAAMLMSVNDVRMEAILTAGIALAAWQGFALLQQSKPVHIAGTALGLAVAFSAKGQIGVVVPGIFIVVTAVSRHKLLTLFSWKWISVLAIFLLLISPVLYCYYLQFNLHPEKTIRGINNIDGIRFILFDQNIQRAGGTWGTAMKNDYLFFVHSFLWTFVPWSLLAVAALIQLLKKRNTRIENAGLLSTFLLFGLLLTFSGFKLPHYLVICFPFAALFTARWMISLYTNPLHTKRYWYIQTGVTSAILIFGLVINSLFFPLTNFLLLIPVVLLLSLVFHYWKTTFLAYSEKMILVPLLAFLLFILAANTSFYPALLQFQAGTSMPATIKGSVDPEKVWFWKNDISASWQFNTGTLRKEFRPRIMALPGKKWLAYYAASEPLIEKSGIPLGKKYIQPDYEITRLTLKFLNPATRDKTLSSLIIVEIPELPY